MSCSKKKDRGLTSEELKRQMYHSLQSAGVLNNLKGYLRQSVINELRGKHHGIGRSSDESDLLAATITKNAESSWNQKAIDNLIFHHLKNSRYLYSLSLFQQESGIEKYNEALTEELLLRLGASPDLLNNREDKENNQSFPSPHSTSTPVANDNGSKSLMWKILSRVSSAQNLATKINQDSLRETKHRPKPMSLADKLQAVDEQMDHTLRERRHGDIDYRQSVATLASATRRAEEAADKRAKESFEQWKKVELATMRVEEMEKTREQILAKTRELENDYSQRKDALLTREKNAIERLSIQKESLEKDLYQQRQLLLAELEQIRIREKNLQERELLMRDMENVRLKELDLMKSEVASQQGQGSGVIGQSQGRSRRDSVVSSCAESLRKSLTGKESRQLDEVLKELDSRSGEAEMLRRELETLKEELNETKNHLRKLSDPKPSPRQRTDISPRASNDNESSLRRRLDDLTRQLNDWKKQDRVDKEANIQNEIGRWKTEVSKLSEAREKLDEKQRQLEQMTSRIHARIGVDSKGGPASPRVRQSSSTSLRILMDDVTREPSIRDYDPVHQGHVRWADEMPHSVQPRLTEGKSPRSSRYPSHDTSGNSNYDLNDSSTTTSSGDLSTSGLRNDIQQKFRTLEKESEELEHMYKRYIQSNYKHISPDVPDYTSTRTQPRPAPKTSSFREKSKSSPTLKQSSSKSGSVPGKKTTIPPKTKSHISPEYQPEQTAPIQSKPVLPEEKKSSTPSFLPTKDKLDQSQGPLDLKSLENKQNLDSDSRAKLVKNESNDLASPPKHRSDQNSAAPSYVSLFKEQSAKKEPIPTKSDEQLGNSLSRKNTTAPSFGDSKFSDDSESSSSSENSYSVTKPIPSPRQSTLPPLSTPNTLPPISPERKLATSSVSDFLIGGIVEQPKLTVTSQGILNEPKPLIRSQTKPTYNSQSENSDSIEEELLSSSSSEISDPLRRSTLEIKSPKSPFDRPALLEQKREELQQIFVNTDSLELSKHDQESFDHGKSPKHDLSLDIGDDDGIKNILQSIDKSSARSLEGETDQDLAELLNQLELKPSMTPQKEFTGVEGSFSFEPDNASKQSHSSMMSQRKPIVTSQYHADEPESPEEDSLSIKKGNKIAEKESKSSPEKDEKLLSDKSNEYSDEFLSSSDSKTASEVKTMSDFEPSSTSIPHIEDKVTGMQQSDDDKSGADANWSNLQLDRSGEPPGLDIAKHREESQRIPERQTEAKDTVDVFEESQSSDSIDVGSRGEKKSVSSGDDFW